MSSRCIDTERCNIIHWLIVEFTFWKTAYIVYHPLCGTLSQRTWYALIMISRELHILIWYQTFYGNLYIMILQIIKAIKSNAYDIHIMIAMEFSHTDGIILCILMYAPPAVRNRLLASRGWSIALREIRCNETPDAVWLRRSFKAATPAIWPISQEEYIW